MITPLEFVYRSRKAPPGYRPCTDLSTEIVRNSRERRANAPARGGEASVHAHAAHQCMPPHRPRSVARRTVYGSKSSGLAGQDRELWDTSLLGVTGTTTTARGVEMPSTILQSLPCPCCKKVLSPGEPGTYAVRPAGSFAECLRRCAVCGI